ncbi:MAG: polyprenol monophosphomannose synthase [Planctomycetes bacterium]|nr:polyprenol monophosphomannose synthase [Planctomycetota bacterium]
MDNSPTNTVTSLRSGLGEMTQRRPPVRVDVSDDSLASTTIVVPTYREAENVVPLLSRIGAAVLPVVKDLEVIIVDDDSNDGTCERVAESGLSWARVDVRRGERGLSSAVIRGCRSASREAIVVMDADLSHPPEAIPDMLRALQDGADFVIGSRYVAGGSLDPTWGVSRRIKSRVATLLARPLTSVSDPMSGFFALRRETFLAAKALDPVGFKIGMELMTKCRCEHISEVPIHFSERVRGASKLDMSEQLRYLRHLSRLWAFRMFSDRD